MTALKKKKNDKVEFRISKEEKERINVAAKILNNDLSDFLRALIMPQVDRITASETNIELNSEAWSGFIKMLSSPKPASATLKDAMKKYRENQE